MDVATAHSSAFTSPGVGAGSSASSNHHSEEPEQRGVSLGIPVHVVIDIPADNEIDFGIGDVDSALLARRPTLNPGTQVVQITITSSCIPGSTHDLSAVHEEVSRSNATLRSAVIIGVAGGVAVGIIDALMLQAPSVWRMAPNLVSLQLGDIEADLCTGIHPIRLIGQAMEVDNHLPAIQELVFLNCPALEEDVEPLAAALKKGHAAQLRVLSWDNSRDGSPESSTNLLLEALASGACPRPHVETLIFADSWSEVNTPLTHLRPAIKACSGLKRLVFDCSSKPVSEVLDLSYAIAMGDVPHMEYVCIRMSEVSSTDPPQQAIAILTSAATSKVPPIRLEVKNG